MPAFTGRLLTMKNLPNLFTLLNLVFGCIAVVFTLQSGIDIVYTRDGEQFIKLTENLCLASLFIVIAAIVDFFDGFVEYFQFGFGCGVFIYNRALLIVIQAPHLFQETVYALYAFGIPWFAYIYRTKKHLVHAESVRTVL